MTIARHADGSRCLQAETTRDCLRSHRWIESERAEYDRLVGTMADVRAAIREEG